MATEMIYIDSKLYDRLHGLALFMDIDLPELCERLLAKSCGDFEERTADLMPAITVKTTRFTIVACGQKRIQGIKALREMTGWSLKASKDAIDKVVDGFSVDVNVEEIPEHYKERSMDAWIKLFEDADCTVQTLTDHRLF